MTTLVATIRVALCALPDARKGGNKQRHAMSDATLDGFGFLPAEPVASGLSVADAEGAGGQQRLRAVRNGKQSLTETDRWLNDLPLRDGDDALTAGWCVLTTIDADEGKVL